MNASNAIPMSKPVTTAVAATLGILQLVQQETESVSQLMQLGIPRATAEIELFHLRNLGAENAIIRSLGGDTRDRVLLAFLQHLEQVSVQAGVGFESFQRELIGRRNRYLPALGGPPKNNPLIPIGQVFSDLCGQNHDVGVMVVGSVEFAAALKFTSEFLEKITIEG